MRKEDQEKARQADPNAEKALANRKYTVMDRLNFVDNIEEKNYLKRMQEALQQTASAGYWQTPIHSLIFTRKRASVKAPTVVQLGKAKRELIPHWCIVNEELEEERLYAHYKKNECLYVWVRSRK